MGFAVAGAGATPDPQSARRQLFARQIAANAFYWQGRLECHAADPASLDVESENLARAVWLGLGSDDTRTAAFELIASARDFIARRGDAEAWGGLLNTAARLAAGGPPSPATVTVLAVAAEVIARYNPGPESDRLYRIALRQCRRLPQHPDLQARILVDFGWMLLNQGAYARGQAYVQQARELAERHDNRPVLARALLGLGTGYNKRREWQAALACLPEALRLAEGLQEANYIGCAHYELGVAYWHAGDMEHARSHAEQALAHLRQSGDISLESHTCNLLGVLCFERDEFGMAVEHFLAAEASLIRAGAQSMVAALHNNLGAAFWGLLRWDDAERYFAMARDEHRAKGDTLAAVEATTNLGECYLDQQKWAEASAALAGARAELAGVEPSAARTSLLERLDELDTRKAASHSPDERPPRGL